MSSKVKGLEYQSSEPAFLRRLRAQNSGQDADGRHERSLPRPTRGKRNDDDDAPTVVIEGSNENMSKEEYKKLLSGQGDSQTEQSDGAGQGDVKSRTETDDVTSEERHAKPVDQTSLGASKKRKVAKVIGEDDEDGEQSKLSKPSQPKNKSTSKKKAKPIKLAFDDDE